MKQPTWFRWLWFIPAAGFFYSAAQGWSIAPWAWHLTWSTLAACILLRWWAWHKLWAAVPLVALWAGLDYNARAEQAGAAAAYVFLGLLALHLASLFIPDLRRR